MTHAFKLTIAALITLVAAFFLLLGNAFAQGLSISWSHPTQYEDGSALALTSIAATRVEWGSCSGTAFGVKAGEQLVTAPATTATIPNLAAGTYCVRAFTRVTTGQESAPSLVASKVITAPLPKPPVLGVINVVAYELVLHPVDGPRLGRSIGTVPLGTACSGEPLVGFDYFEVPRSAVTITKAPKSQILVAKCG